MDWLQWKTTSTATGLPVFECEHFQIAGVLTATCQKCGEMQPRKAA